MHLKCSCSSVWTDYDANTMTVVYCCPRHGAYHKISLEEAKSKWPDVKFGELLDLRDILPLERERKNLQNTVSAIDSLPKEPGVHFLWADVIIHPNWQSDPILREKNKMNKLTFGKYKDYEIEDVPVDYLEWLIGVRKKELDIFETEIRRRQVLDSLDGSVIKEMLDRGKSALLKDGFNASEVDDAYNTVVALSKGYKKEVKELFDLMGD